MTITGMFSAADFQAIWLTIKLATVVTAILLVIGTPVAWWLARSHSRWKALVVAFIALPLVLPPTVLGFYFLLAMGPDGFIGKITHSLGLGTLAFTFPGLVIASVIYSLPFVVQPIHNAIEALGNKPLEAAATLRASPLDTFFHVVLPLAKPGFISAAVLSFAHTIGEFGVILMIGGNIPGATQVISVQIYNHVEAMNYAHAHALSITMIVFSFVVLTCLYSLNRKTARTRLNTEAK